MASYIVVVCNVHEYWRIKADYDIIFKEVKRIVKTNKNMLFVSYSYVGVYENGTEYYRGFGNEYMSFSTEPKNKEMMKLLTEKVNDKVAQKMGLSRVTCEILFFKPIDY